MSKRIAVLCRQEKPFKENLSLEQLLFLPSKEMRVWVAIWVSWQPDFTSIIIEHGVDIISTEAVAYMNLVCLVDEEGSGIKEFVMQ